VVSWNVWWRFGDRWEERQVRILQTLTDLSPDVVGLQEAWGMDETSQAEWLGDRLGMSHRYAHPSLPPVPDVPEHPQQEGVTLGVAVMSRHPIIEAEETSLPARHHERPVALRVTVAHPLGPLHVICAAVEWEPSHADDHLAQTRRLAAMAAASGLDGPLPVLVLADLNAPPGSPEVTALTEVAADLWEEGGGDPDAVTLSSANPFAPLEAWRQIDQRIDYVLARPGRPGRVPRVRAVRLAGAELDPIPPSDHHAVVVDLEV
jgi:endonuclease/exonuclease/phosphatase family metal-dependent hydrolase